MEHSSVRKLWQEYLAANGKQEEEANKRYTSWHFCDNKKDAEELVELVLQGVKRATASLYACYEYEQEEPPKAGNYSVITDWDGIARCIIETTGVQLFPFNQVPPEFAATEGEGDGSLEYWRRVHWDCFTRDMAEMGGEPSEDMLVVCEEFQVVYRSDRSGL